jgi:hypothetical protein
MLSLDAASRESGMRVALPPARCESNSDPIVRNSSVCCASERERERERVEKCAHT